MKTHFKKSSFQQAHQENIINNLSFLLPLITFSPYQTQWHIKQIISLSCFFLHKLKEKNLEKYKWNFSFLTLINSYIISHKSVPDLKLNNTKILWQNIGTKNKSEEIWKGKIFSNTYNKFEGTCFPSFFVWIQMDFFIYFIPLFLHTKNIVMK